MDTRAIADYFEYYFSKIIDLYESNIFVKAVLLIILFSMMFNIFYFLGTKIGKFLRKKQNLTH